MEGTGTGTGTGSEQNFRPITIQSSPRIAAIVLAVILLIVSAATIGIINNNDDLNLFREYAKTGVPLTDDQQDLLNLINASVAAASWLIVMSIVVATAEIIAIVFLSGIINIQPKIILIFDITDIFVSGAVILAYFGTGIPCAVYASKWGMTPAACGDQLEEDVCSSIPLTATNALEAVFCFIQVGVFGLIAGMTINKLLKSRKQTT